MPSYYFFNDNSQCITCVLKLSGGGGKQKLQVKDLMEQHPMLFRTLTPGNRDYISSVDEAWFVKRKEQLY